MKTLRLFVVLAALLFAGMLAPSPVRARETVSFDFFYDSLAPYGEWVEVGDYGLCWRPAGVDPDWTPYSDGYWAYTDAGWTWVSYEEFGGIVYHYGRWIRLDDDSWCWTPDYEWAPAWVSWRTSDDYVGWAPLPPEARWRPEVGISVWADREYDLGPGYYSFCRTRDFGAPVMRGVCINRRENVTIIRTTVNVTNISYNRTYVDGPVIFNGGPSYTVINRISTRPIPALKLVQEANFDRAHHRGPNGRASFNAQTVGNQLIVAAPQVLKPTDLGAFKARAKRILPGDSVTRGWNGVKSPEVQKELRQEMGRQAKGLTPTTAPARAVVATDLKVVPTKADPTATPPTTANTDRRDRPDRQGKGPRPDGVVLQPNNNPPGNPPTGPAATPFVKPASPVTTTTPGKPPGDPNAVTRGRERGRDRNDRDPNPPGAPTASNPNLKPFNTTPDTRPPQNPPTGTVPVPRSTSTDDNGAKERAAEQARIRAEQQRMDQQRQADSVAKQKQADMAVQQQKQIAAQQEVARSRAEDVRRREAADLQRQQQQQIQIQQQQQQQLRQQQIIQQQQKEQQQQRSMDARRAQDAEKAARERARDQAESQRAQQPRQLPPQPQPQPQQNTQGVPPRPGGGQQQHQKGGDKDKDKDKDRN